MSVDLEEYFQVSNLASAIDRSRWDDLSSRVADPTCRLLDTFDRTGNRATFFVLGWVAERQPSLVRAIADRGHEVACHGYGHQLVYDLSPQDFRADLRRARRAIEDATGVAVRGYRAPSYSIVPRSAWALSILAEEGFAFDSSIFPIRHHRYGWPAFSREPVRIELSGGSSISEFPMTTFRIGRANLPLAGGAYLRFFPPAVFRWGLSRLEAKGRPIVLYTHPWELDPDQPRADVGWLVKLNHYLNLGRTEGRLTTLLERFRFDTVGAVLEGLDRRGALPIWNLEKIASAA